MIPFVLLNRRFHHHLILQDRPGLRQKKTGIINKNGKKSIIKNWFLKILRWSY